MDGAEQGEIAVMSKLSWKKELWRKKYLSDENEVRRFELGEQIYVVG
jgi:hypothetical protein